MSLPILLFLVWLLSNPRDASTRNITSDLRGVTDEFGE